MLTSDATPSGKNRRQHSKNRSSGRVCHPSLRQLHWHLCLHSCMPASVPNLPSRLLSPPPRPTAARETLTAPNNRLATSSLLMSSSGHPSRDAASFLPLGPSPLPPTFGFVSGPRCDVSFFGFPAAFGMGHSSRRTSLPCLLCLLLCRLSCLLGPCQGVNIHRCSSSPTHACLEELLGRQLRASHSCRACCSRSEAGTARGVLPWLLVVKVSVEASFVEVRERRLGRRELVVVS